MAESFQIVNKHTDPNYCDDQCDGKCFGIHIDFFVSNVLIGNRFLGVNRKKNFYTCELNLCLIHLSRQLDRKWRALVPHSVLKA